MLTIVANITVQSVGGNSAIGQGNTGYAVSNLGNLKATGTSAETTSSSRSHRSCS